MPSSSVSLQPGTHGKRCMDQRTLSFLAASAGSTTWSTTSSASRPAASRRQFAALAHRSGESSHAPPARIVRSASNPNLDPFTISFRKSWPTTIVSILYRSRSQSLSVPLPAPCTRTAQIDQRVRWPDTPDTLLTGAPSRIIRSFRSVLGTAAACEVCVAKLCLEQGVRRAGGQDRVGKRESRTRHCAGRCNASISREIVNDSSTVAKVCAMRRRKAAIGTVGRLASRRRIGRT